VQRAAQNGFPIQMRYMFHVHVQTEISILLLRSLFGIYANLPRWLKTALTILPFAILIAGYVWIADKRHQENPSDKVTPTIRQLAEGFYRAATEPDRDGKIRLWVDTVASLRRLAIGVLLAAMAGILFGLHLGVMPFFEATFLRFVTFFDKIPALALLPILFITLGLEETAKVALIFIGIVPTITLDTYLRAKEIPQEQFVKAFTLGASDFEATYKVVLPQIFPKALDSVRLNLKGAWLFLIAAESIAATEGLGYRIFVVRRYLAMDIIIPYVIWIALLAFLMDSILRLWVKKGFRWLES
jgi:NitT/TauT family transport system permease protein